MIIILIKINQELIPMLNTNKEQEHTHCEHTSPTCLQSFRKGLIGTGSLPVSLLSVLALTAENYFALAIIFGLHDKPLPKDTNIGQLALEITTLLIAMGSAIPDGFVIFYHMLQEHNRLLHEEHHHEHENNEKPSCPLLRKTISLVINLISSLLRMGLTVVAVKELTNKFIVTPWSNSISDVLKQIILWGPSAILSVFATIGSVFTEGHHTHNALTESKLSLSRLCNIKQLCLKIIPCTVFFTTLLSHGTAYYLDSYAIISQIPNQSESIQLLLKLLGALLAISPALQDGFIESRHVEMVIDFARTLRCTISDAIGIVFALINMFAHGVPSFAGTYLIFKSFNADNAIALTFSAILSGIDAIPSLAMHGRYIIEACRDIANKLNKILSCCSRQINYHEEIEKKFMNALTQRSTIVDIKEIEPVTESTQFIMTVNPHYKKQSISCFTYCWARLFGSSQNEKKYIIEEGNSLVNSNLAHNFN